MIDSSAVADPFRLGPLNENYKTKIISLAARGADLVAAITAAGGAAVVPQQGVTDQGRARSIVIVHPGAGHLLHWSGVARRLARELGAVRDGNPPRLRPQLVRGDVLQQHAVERALLAEVRIEHEERVQ